MGPDLRNHKKKRITQSQFLLPLQNACFNRCKITSVASLRFITRVSLQTFFKTPCVNICKFTLVTFVRSFPWVSFHMFLQITCCSSHIGRIWTIFLRISFQMAPETTHLNIGCNCGPYPLFFCVLKWFSPTDPWSYWWRLLAFFSFARSLLKVSEASMTVTNC